MYDVRQILCRVSCLPETRTLVSWSLGNMEFIKIFLTEPVLGLKWLFFKLETTLEIYSEDIYHTVITSLLFVRHRVRAFCVCVCIGIWLERERVNVWPINNWNKHLVFHIFDTRKLSHWMNTLISNTISPI